MTLGGVYLASSELAGVLSTAGLSTSIGAPLNITGKVEIEFTPGSGVFIDVSTRISNIEITRPRYTQDQGATPTTVTITAYNHPATATEVAAWGTISGAGFCPFVPDSPAGAFYPRITRDLLIRVTATWGGGAHSSVRFFGWIDVWAPEAGANPPETSVVTITASDVLSRFARRNLMSWYGELLVQETLTQPSDYWPYNEDSDALVLKGFSADNGAADAKVIPASNGLGSLTFQDPDGTILVDGSASFQRSDSGSPSPVILHKLRGGTNVIGRISVWVKLTDDPSGASDDVFGVYRADGSVVWRLLANIVSGLVVWQVWDSTNAVMSTWSSGYARDDSWHWVSVLTVQNFGGDWTTNIAVRDKVVPDRVVAGGFNGFADDPRFGDYLVVGGRMLPTRKGKQTNTLQGDISGPHIYYGDPGSSYSFLSAASDIQSANSRAQLLVLTSLPIEAPLGGGVGSTTSGSAPIALTNARSTLLDGFNELALTIGGAIITQPGGKREIQGPGTVRSSTVMLTLDAEQDLSGPDGGWVGVKDERPTRISVESPVGTALVVDTAGETALGQRLEGNLPMTSAGSVEVAASVGQLAVYRSGTRLSSFGVDASVTSTDKMAAIMAIRPGDRVRVSNLPAAYAGITYLDVYASGWVETYVAADQSCILVFDSDPAEPSEAVFDDAEYGRFASAGASVTGGTCVGSTGTGTIIVTSTDPLSTSAGQYPVDLDWNGERITITTAPGGATSPQTLTVTARGVAPSVARVHATGETIDIYHAARFGA